MSLPITHLPDDQLVSALDVKGDCLGKLALDVKGDCLGKLVCQNSELSDLQYALLCMRVRVCVSNQNPEESSKNIRTLTGSM